MGRVSSVPQQLVGICHTCRQAQRLLGGIAGGCLCSLRGPPDGKCSLAPVQKAALPA